MFPLLKVNALGVFRSSDNVSRLSSQINRCLGATSSKLKKNAIKRNPRVDSTWGLANCRGRPDPRKVSGVHCTCRWEVRLRDRLGKTVSLITRLTGTTERQWRWHRRSESQMLASGASHHAPKKERQDATERPVARLVLILNYSISTDGLSQNSVFMSIANCQKQHHVQLT